MNTINSLEKKIEVAQKSIVINNILCSMLIEYLKQSKYDDNKSVEEIKNLIMIIHMTIKVSMMIDLGAENGLSTMETGLNTMLKMINNSHERFTPSREILESHTDHNGTELLKAEVCLVLDLMKTHVSAALCIIKNESMITSN